MVIRDCFLCGSKGCKFCIRPEEVLQMRHDALATLSNGSENVVDLIAERADAYGVYRLDDPQKQKSVRPREVDADCVFCQKRPVIDIEKVGYFCQSCGEEQPIEFVGCVYCDTVSSAVKRIDGCKCYLCDREQPTDSNVVPIR